MLTHLHKFLGSQAAEPNKTVFFFLGLGVCVCHVIVKRVSEGITIF